MNLAGKVAIVTGSSAGIGAAIARNLSEAGAKLVLTARREDRLKEMQASLPNESAILAADIGAPEAADQLLALAQERFGRADILVNNAGILSTNPIDLIDIELMAKMIQVNFEAVMRLSYTFGRAFKAQGEGAIINVSSIGGSLTVPTWGVYCAVKAAVETFSESLRIELGSSGVKVGIVAPGSTKRESHRAGNRLSGSRGYRPCRAFYAGAAKPCQHCAPAPVRIGRDCLICCFDSLRDGSGLWRGKDFSPIC